MSDIETIVSDLKNAHWEAMDEITRLRAELAAVTAERDRMQHRLDAAYNVIDMDIKNDMAFAEKHANLLLENERLHDALKPLAKAIKGQIADILFGKMPDNSTATVILQLGDLRRARAALEGVTEQERQS